MRAIDMRAIDMRAAGLWERRPAHWPERRRGMHPAAGPRER